MVANTLLVRFISRGKEDRSYDNQKLCSHPRELYKISSRSTVHCFLLSTTALTSCCALVQLCGVVLLSTDLHEDGSLLAESISSPPPTFFQPNKGIAVIDFLIGHTRNVLASFALT